MREETALPACPPAKSAALGTTGNENSEVAETPVAKNRPMRVAARENFRSEALLLELKTFRVERSRPGVRSSLLGTVTTSAKDSRKKQTDSTTAVKKTTNPAKRAPESRGKDFKTSLASEQTSAENASKEANADFRPFRELLTGFMTFNSD